MFILLLILIFLLIIAIPIGLSYLIYRFIKKRNYNKGFRLIALTPILIVAYLIYSALYPSEEFYRADFIEVAGVELPEEVDFKYKTATYPDQFGDYTSISVIHVGKDFYKRLPEILTDKGFVENGRLSQSKGFDKALAYTNNLDIERAYSVEEGGGVLYYVGFITDNETILVKRQSW